MKPFMCTVYLRLFCMLKLAEECERKESVVRDQEIWDIFETFFVI